MLGLSTLFVISLVRVLVFTHTVRLQESRASSPRPSSPYPVTVARSIEDGGFNFTSFDDRRYTATILVNGVPYQVILDTDCDELNHAIRRPYYRHRAFLAKVSFGPYTVYNQAIGPFSGIIGLAGYSEEYQVFNSSEIHSTFAEAPYAEYGIPIVYNIFEHTPDLPNYTTFLMEHGDAVINVTDSFKTPAEVLADMIDILNSPRLRTVIPDSWATILDGVYVNGEFLNGSQYEGKSWVHWLLGDSFLRNVYSLYGYGDPERGRVAKEPYTQLLRRTNPDKAWLEFDSLLARLISYQEAYYISSASSGASTTPIPVYTGVRPTVILTEVLSNPTTIGTPRVQASTTNPGAILNSNLEAAGAAADDSSNSSGKIDPSCLTRNSYIILALLAIVLVVLILTIALMVKAERGNTRYRAVPTGDIARGKVFEVEEDMVYETPYADSGR
ncbi:hypothetical protein BN946_scf184993.g2, partial [Trametes cinnabarina]